jgi:nicotinate-nucleotide adenylyltransferase
MSSKVAIVGITGDPPTIGHIWLAKTAQNTGLFDDVWLMPCYEHMYGKKTESVLHRLNMTQIASKEAGVSWSDYEIASNLNGACHKTVTSLRRDFPNNEFVWVIGMDNALSIDKWENAEVLKSGELVSFLVCNRSGIEVPPGDHWFYDLPHHFVESRGSVECSSTEFKRLYRQSDAHCVGMVSPGVFEYILDNGLYTRDES